MKMIPINITGGFPPNLPRPVSTTKTPPPCSSPWFHPLWIAACCHRLHFGIFFSLYFVLELIWIVSVFHRKSFDTSSSGDDRLERNSTLPSKPCQEHCQGRHQALKPLKPSKPLKPTLKALKTGQEHIQSLSSLGLVWIVGCVNSGACLDISFSLVIKLE